MSTPISNNSIRLCDARREQRRRRREYLNNRRANQGIHCGNLNVTNSGVEYRNAPQNVRRHEMQDSEHESLHSRRRENYVMMRTQERTSMSTSIYTKRKPNSIASLTNFSPNVDLHKHINT
ncbi:hypothetical protein LIER_39898 [Lithospermum erythrorhizon]|uniref:Uncharacterized protein n=1 Tax=Lithospermum erythrorhizon TaxID=34254 RepID=A0AAV3QPS3_LITER